jgi:hypothetical protein
MNLYLLIFGIVGLVFRIWLCEIKLKKELEFRSRYVSRFLTYYYFIAMMLSFEVYAFNLMIVISLPMMLIITVFFDIPFMIKFGDKENEVNNRGWLFIERFTLHPPLIITGIYWFIIDLTVAFDPFPNILDILLCYGIILVTYSQLDVRWKKKYLWPEGKWMMIFMSFSTFMFAIYFLIDFSEYFA